MLPMLGRGSFLKYPHHNVHPRLAKIDDTCAAQLYVLCRLADCVDVVVLSTYRYDSAHSVCERLQTNDP